MKRGQSFPQSGHELTGTNPFVVVMKAQVRELCLLLCVNLTQLDVTDSQTQDIGGRTGV